MLFRLFALLSYSYFDAPAAFLPPNPESITFSVLSLPLLQLIPNCPLSAR